MLTESCAVSSVMAKDPRFQALKEAYKDKRYTDDHLAQALQMCREYHDYPSDWFPETKGQRGVFTRFINHDLVNMKVARTTSELTRDSVYNLYTTMYSLYTPQQLENRLDMLAHDFTKMVDHLEKNDSQEGGKHTRLQLIKLAAKDKMNGYAKLMSDLFSIYEKKYTNVNWQMARFEESHPNATEQEKNDARKEAEYRAQEYRTILKNKERLAALAAVKIGESEGFIVTTRDFEIDLDEPTDEDIINDNEEVQKEEGEADYEEGSKGDRFGDFRTARLMNTLSVRAKRLLNSINRVDSNGDVVSDDLGRPLSIGGRQVAVVLKKTLVNSTPDTMMSDLRTAETFYPWMNGLIKKLEANTDLQTIVYDDFKSAESTYVYAKFDKGSYSLHVANTRAAGGAIAREAGNNLRAGWVLDEQSSLYTGYGVLKPMDGPGGIREIRERFEAIRNVFNSRTGISLISMVEGDKQKSKIIEDTIKSAAEKGQNLEYLRLSPEKAMDAFLNEHESELLELTSILRGMGFNVRMKDLRDIAKQTMNKKGFGFVAGWINREASEGRNKLYRLIDRMEGVFKRLEQMSKNIKPKEWTGQYLFNTADSSFSGINRCLSLAQYNEVEARVVSEGKSLSTYNNVNLLRQTFDALANRDKRDEKRYQEDLEKDFLQYEGMALGKGGLRTVTGWLNMFKENTDGIRDKFRIVDMSAFSHVEYADLSREQKLMNTILMYFNGGKLLQMEGFGLVEYPIQADYSTAYNFVTAKRLSTISNDGPFARKHGDIELDTELMDALVNEILIERERIAAIKERLNDDSRIKLSVYEEQGMKYQIFPEFNDNGFDEGYAAARSINAVEAKDFVRIQIAEQLQKIIDKDFESLEDAGVLSHPGMKNLYFGHNNYGSLRADKGLVKNLSTKQRQKFVDCFLNIFYAREQSTKIVTGGLEHFDGLIDFEKRNMLSHATRTSLYTNATWNGKRVGKETQNVVYVGDEQSQTAFIDDIKEMLGELLNEKVITRSQYNTMIDSYSKIKTTDGQGLRTMESYREVMIMANQWDKQHEAAYHRIMTGKQRKTDIDLFMQNIKPVLTGYEHIKEAAGANQKPVRLTVLHKYSEMVLLPLTLAQHNLQAKSVPMRAFADAQEKLRKAGKQVDMFLFHSGVKVGAHSIIRPFAKWKDIKGREGRTDEEERKLYGWNGQDLNERILSSANAISDYIVGKITDKESTMHVLPYKYYGIAASTPPHAANDRIAWASQAEKVAWANILKGQKIKIDNSVMDAWDAREKYFEIKTADIIETYQELVKIFQDSDELERVFQSELASKSYSSRELTYALAHLKDGTFALPLFSPNVEHQVQSLLASVIKKRLTKPRKKGANILQSTSLGMDIEASAFDNNNSLSEDEKLRVVFEGNGANKRVKYVEVYLPIHDDRLKRFANKDGNITYEMLYGENGLIKRGVIPEEILNFIAYRTPSDAEHSVIPCRVKGFLANTSGATIKMPKEIMVMTGHDYDGDKMRCHFIDFDVIDEEVDASDENIKNVLFSGGDINSAFRRKIVPIKYDYTKSPLENSRVARANARVELMFAELTSPAGSRRMLIPGGCDESKVYAKSLYLIRASEDNRVKSKIADTIIDQEVKKYLDKHSGASREEALNNIDIKKIRSAVTNSTDLYNMLTSRSDGSLTGILRVVSSIETPFTMTHSADAFDYIMGGAELIGIYATYNSALQMLQRLDINYLPQITKDGKASYSVSFFKNENGTLHTFGKLFDVKNHQGGLASLGLARLLNAAVDNNKDPILGYLNQTKEMAEMTFLMFAAGMTEEEIHLVMNQPAVLRLIERMKARDHDELKEEIQNVISEIAEDNKELNEIYPYLALKNLEKYEKSDYTACLSMPLEVMKANDFAAMKMQISILQALGHLAPAASDLATFVRLTRPESESGAIGSDVGSIVSKIIDLNNFRDKIAPESLVPKHFSGMHDVLKRRIVQTGIESGYIEEILGSNLPEVVALNTLMIDEAPDMFRPYFPQAKQDWMDLEAEISEQYNTKRTEGGGIIKKGYKKTQSGIVSKVGAEAILWKLLSNKQFVGGNPQEEQRRILIDVPKQLKDLQQRIGHAVTHPGKDTAAGALVGNVFLSHLMTTSPENSQDTPRLQFDLNGPASEGTADAIRAHWGAMLGSSDEKIRNLAIDLFKYNLYTNGFTYGMYEFSHFAPFSVIVSTPGYLDALNDVLNSRWNNEDDRENFIHQYYMNHWGDKNFLRFVKLDKLKLVKLPEGIKRQLWISAEDKTAATIEGEKYVVVTVNDENKTQLLYRVLGRNSEGTLMLELAQKLGARNFNQQVTLQYNPTVGYKEVKPVVPGNDSAWGVLDKAVDYGESNYNAEYSGQESDPGYVNSLKKDYRDAALDWFRRSGRAKEMSKVEAEAEKNVEKNEKALEQVSPIDTTPEPAPLTEDEQEAASEPISFSAFGRAFDTNAFEGAKVGSGTESGQMFYIARRDESGNVVNDRVPVTPRSIREARKQKVFVELNKRLREILRDKGVSVGVLSDVEARMSLGGVTDFDTATVTAEGLLEMIRVAEGYLGEKALPEEFAHMAIEMLGHDNVLVSRLIGTLQRNREAMQEAYDGQYDEYENRYGEENIDKLALEAAGKLVAKHLFRQQEIQTSGIKRLVYRVVDAIKSLLRRFRRDEIQNAIFDANDIASKLAREMLGGKLVDQMDIQNISSTGQFLAVQKDLTGKNDILSKLLKNETKRLAVLKKRLAYHNNKKPHAVVAATELQIKKLENAIANYKTEDAIVTYMSDSLAFLQVMERALDDAVNSSRPVNAVCKRLNTVRDTLYSFSSAINDIRESIIDGEVRDTATINASIDQVSGVLARFHQKYETLARTYFEEMLSNVYGSAGTTITVGKEKGRTISIKEMARKADRDISLASRWFHAIADCNDYVLKAIDDVTRNAKMRARRRAANIRPRIEKAMADLVAETGSRDQSFMFEKRRYDGEKWCLGAKDDGKMHKTGKYIATTSDAYKNLSSAQKAFYDTMMSIKKDVDKYLPESLIEDNKIIMMRKYTMDRFKDAEGAKGKAIEMWEGLKNRVMESGDVDFENYEVAVDFEGNRVDMLPVKFLLRGSTEQYDDMSDDVATSMMAYAGMGYEYSEMNAVIGTLENAKYMASEREISQHAGGRRMIEKIGFKKNGQEDKDIPHSFTEPFTVKQAQTNIQKALEDFFQMHIYGRVRANEGTIGNTRLSKRKVVDTINSVTSLSQMAINIPQRIANVNTGLTQIVIESIGKGHFSAKNVAWASGVYMKESGDRLAETGQTDYDNKLSLWDEYFDVHQNNGRYDSKYKKGRMSRIFNSGLLYAGLTMGEDYLASTTSLALAKNFKVKGPDGKEDNLWNAYEVKYSDSTNNIGAYLALKEGYTKMDGSPITFDDEQRFSKKVAGMNFEMQGIYNVDDRSAVQQYAFGALIIMYRKWIAPAIKRRYASASYSALKDEYQEGYHRTLFRTIGDIINNAKEQVSSEEWTKSAWNIIADMKALRTAILLNWNKMTDYEKSNITRSLTELGIVIGLFLSCSLMGKIPPSDDDEKGRFLSWFEQTVFSQMLRLRTEIGSQAPTPMLVDEAMHILKSPFAAIGPLQNAIKAFEIVYPPNWFTEVKSGRYRGHSKSYKYFREMPIISMFKKVDNFLDPSPLIQYYQNDINL